MQIDSGDNIEARCLLDREQLVNQTHSLYIFSHDVKMISQNENKTWRRDVEWQEMGENGILEEKIQWATKRCFDVWFISSMANDIVSFACVDEERRRSDWMALCIFKRIIQQQCAVAARKLTVNWRRRRREKKKKCSEYRRNEKCACRRRKFRYSSESFLWWWIKRGHKRSDGMFPNTCSGWWRKECMDKIENRKKKTLSISLFLSLC